MGDGAGLALPLLSWLNLRPIPRSCTALLFRTPEAPVDDTALSGSRIHLHLEPSKRGVRILDLPEGLSVLWCIPSGFGGILLTRRGWFLTNMHLLKRGKATGG